MLFQESAFWYPGLFSPFTERLIRRCRRVYVGIWARFAARLWGEPAVAVPESLGPGSLGVAHDAEPVVVGVEADDPVVPHPESLSGAREVRVLGREAQEPGVGMDCLLPKGGSAAEGAGPVVDPPVYPDADPVGCAGSKRGALALPVAHRFEAVLVLDHPDELLGLYPEGYVTPLLFWRRACWTPSVQLLTSILGGCSSWFMPGSTTQLPGLQDVVPLWTGPRCSVL